MRRVLSRTALVAATSLVGVALAGSAAAQAPSKQQCVTANESAQALRRAGKLRDARAQLLACVNPACPGPVRDDCADRLNEVEKALPTLVFAAKDAGGADVTAVRVTMDGQPLADSLSAAAVAVDPGEHVFAFEGDGYARVEKSVLVREGDKERRVAVQLQATATATPPAPSPAAEASPPQQPVPAAPPARAPSATVPAATPAAALPSAGTEAAEEKTAAVGEPPSTASRLPAYVALGIGGAGVVVTSVFGVLALGNKSSLDSACGSDRRSCPPSAQEDISAMHTNSIVSDVGLGVAVVGVGVGAVLLLLEGAGPSGAGDGAEKTSGVHVETIVGLGALGVRGAF